MNKNTFGGGSSLFISTAAVVAWPVLGVISAVFDLKTLAGVFFFLFLLSGAARLWGTKAMKGVSVSVSCPSARLYPQMSTEIGYTVKNEKLLPLIWLELSQSVPHRDCLLPDDSFERYSYRTGAKDDIPTVDAYRRTFSFVMGYETLTFNSTWTANRRGIYKPERLLLRSGDGFGLTQIESEYPPEKLPEIVVYPRRVSVDVSYFLKSDWQHTTGSSGFYEDMTVLRGLRPYQRSDSWKRINWRMAARKIDELSVNFYETIQPRSALFILDGESFCGLSSEFDELEAALETLASVITDLFSRGVSCGVCLPRSKSFRPIALPPGEGRYTAELLYYLAGYECLAEHSLLEDGTASDKFSPSRFDLSSVASAALSAGTVAVITYSPDELSPKLIDHLGRTSVTVFSAGSAVSTDPELKVLPLEKLRKGDEK